MFLQHEKAPHRASDQALIRSCEAPRLFSHPYLFLRAWHLWDHSPLYSLLVADEYHQSRATRQRSYFASSWREKRRDVPLSWLQLRAQDSSTSRCMHPALMPRGLRLSRAGGATQPATQLRHLIGVSMPAAPVITGGSACQAPCLLHRSCRQ